MIPYERQNRIVEILSEFDLLKIEELQKKIPDTSISTLRRDLKELEKHNKVEMLTGGAVKGVTTVAELPISTKAAIQTKEKRYIAQLAAREVCDNETIYIDSGSSCTLLMEELLNRKIHIVTSNMAAFSVTGELKAEITILGGKMDLSISSLSGPLTEGNIRNFIFDRSFFGANGVDIRFGITTPKIEEASKKRVVFEQSKKNYLLADSSKFHKVSSVKIFDLNDITLISNQENTDFSESIEVISK